MTLVGHASRIGALALALLLLVVARADAAAVVAYVPGATLAQLSELPGASAGLLNTAQGRYRQTQALLDISQGSRTSISAYDPPDPPALRVEEDGRVSGWAAAVARAEAAPATVVPGLLAQAAGGAGYVGPASAPRDGGIPAADRSGRIARLDLADEAATVATVLDQARELAVVFARLPDLAALRRLLAQRPDDMLVLATAAPPPGTLPGSVLPIAAYGLGEGHDLTSATTRTDGLVTGIDIAPTMLAWSGIAIPDDMTGKPIELGGDMDLAALRDLRDRMQVVKGRRLPTFGVLIGAWAVLALGAVAVRRREGWRWAVRTGALGVLWVLPVLLLFGALAPGAAEVEAAGVALSALALGTLTGALVRWPAGPAVPGMVAVVAYAVDLAFGSPLIVRSLLGSNPFGGSRFYGIGNELEAILPVLGLAALAAVACATGRAERSTRLATTFALGGLALGVVLGWSRLGADVGGVITVGAAAAAATVLALPGRMTWRRVALAVAVPALALAALAVLDLATGGEGHFSRLVLRSGDGEAFGDALERRGDLALDNLLYNGVMPLLTVLALGLIAWGIWRRDRLLAGVPGADAWRAALGGCAAAAIIGSLSNDSGPLLLVFATFVTAWISAYLRAGSRTGPGRAMV